MKTTTLLAFLLWLSGSALFFCIMDAEKYYTAAMRNYDTLRCVESAKCDIAQLEQAAASNQIMDDLKYSFMRQDAEKNLNRHIEDLRRLTKHDAIQQRSLNFLIPHVQQRAKESGLDQRDVALCEVMTDTLNDIRQEERESLAKNRNRLRRVDWQTKTAAFIVHILSLLLGLRLAEEKWVPKNGLPALVRDVPLQSSAP